MKWFKLDTYVVAEIFRSFLACLFFVIVVYLMLQSLRLADFLIVHQTALADVFWISFFLVVLCLSHTLPVAFLVAILFALGRLSEHRELMAYRSLGLSFKRLIVILNILACGIAGFIFLLVQTWVPNAQKGLKQTIASIARSQTKSLLQPGIIHENFSGAMIFVKQQNTAGQLENVFILYPLTNPILYTAKYADIVSQPQGLTLRLQQGALYQWDQLMVEKVSFSLYEVVLEDLKTYSYTPKPSWLSYGELNEKLRQPFCLAKKKELYVEQQRRIALILCPFLLVLIGVAFGGYCTRHAQSRAAIVSISISALYWVLQSVCFHLALSSSFSPVIVLQLPNLALLCIGIIGLQKNYFNF